MGGSSIGYLGLWSMVFIVLQLLQLIPSIWKLLQKHPSFSLFLLGSVYCLSQSWTSSGHTHCRCACFNAVFVLRHNFLLWFLRNCLLLFLSYLLLGPWLLNLFSTINKFREIIEGCLHNHNKINKITEGCLYNHNKINKITEWCLHNQQN
jgi:hypothetical protein